MAFFSCGIVGRIFCFVLKGEVVERKCRKYHACGGMKRYQVVGWMDS